MTVTREPMLDEPPEGTARRAERREAVDFDGLYHAHFRSLTLQLTAYCGDLSQAQDMVQEAFCRAFARWSRVSRYDDPVAWVRRVAWNLATSRWRRLRTAQAWLHRQREEYVPGPGPDRVALTAALSELPPHQRRAVVLHYLADLSVAQIAAQEDVPEGTVKSWLHRGRTALAAKLTTTSEVNHHD
ncbi:MULTISPECIES: SigE family RNA polymerase sigma factor [unclassified Micromonospora]|uniref:RNA polymerase sigma factor n=1 Tax=unclassified Micromonospora TaxID=2617518 RepID=UPI00259CF495|nr:MULTISPECIES: SigE family RNA polymerase sigma factor [unclassified Micromonospora]MDM4782801.1 SigE family RNA polymerase sigma factor [Micromonospora sp. b486]